ncbi:MAG: methylmalonyl Co-A mutase-associated GTPase MeaB [Chloroflexi bacterium]|nr:methylmalonyl Co-A mutase-associated GTPase MeaB [Chloroflexota bacterium]
MTPLPSTAPTLAEQVRQGNVRAIARLISQVEREEPSAQAEIAALYPHTGRAHIIGVTGAPGTGKSSLVNELAKELRRREKTVAIVAVDPSSPFTGGALLGDRVRMRDLAGDKGIFIRSMASRGRLGGLARSTAGVIKVLDAAAYHTILIETVGAGQAEVDIASAAHSTIVIEAPGLGDEVQSIKAGILEIADILVVNKADHPNSQRTVKSLEMMLHFGSTRQMVRHHGEMMLADDGHTPTDDTSPDWEVKVYETVATASQGIDKVVDALEAHLVYLRTSGEWHEREKVRGRQEVEQLLQALVLRQLQATVSPVEREQLIAAVAERKMDPYAAANRLFIHLNH